MKASARASSENMLQMPAPRSRNDARPHLHESCKHSSKVSVIIFNWPWTQRKRAKATAKAFAARFSAQKIFWQTSDSNFNCWRNTQQHGPGPLSKSGCKKLF